MEPLYYFHSANSFCISNSILTLLEQGAPRELDDVALSVFLRRQNFLGNDTAFKAIRCVPPNSKVTWSKGTLNIESIPFHSKLQPMKHDEIVDSIVDLFRQSMTRRLPRSDRFTVPLSGGKDSRLVLFELVRNNRRPAFCVTGRHPPPRGNEDASVAKLLCDSLGIDCVTIPVLQADLKKEDEKNLNTQFATIEHQWGIQVSGYLEEHVDTSYDGINVDCILYGPKRARLFAEGQFRELAEDFLGDSEAALSRLLNDKSYKRFSREKAIDRMIQDLKVHAEQVCPVSNFQFWGRTRRLVSTVPFGLMRNVGTVHTPFLDREFFEFMMSVPEEPMVGGDIVKEAVAKAFPEYSDIPYAELGLTDAPRKNHNRRFSMQMFHHLATQRRDTEIVDLKRTLATLGKSAISGSQQRLEWIQPYLLYYMLQLEDHASA